MDQRRWRNQYILNTLYSEILSRIYLGGSNRLSSTTLRQKFYRIAYLFGSKKHVTNKMISKNINKQFPVIAKSLTEMFL